MLPHLVVECATLFILFVCFVKLAGCCQRIAQSRASQRLKTQVAVAFDKGQHVG